MARNMFAVAAAMLLTITAVLTQGRAQGLSPQQGTQPTTQEVTLTGCVVAANSAGAFILDNAIEQPGSTETPRTFRLIGAAEDMDFMQHLNHRVRVVGTAELRTPPPPPAGGKVAERDLPLMSVKSIESLGDTCAGR